MSKQSPENEDPASLTVVVPATIAQFEREPHEITVLYDQLYASNPDLALWLRRRAFQISSDIHEREISAQLALELGALLSTQTDVNSLEKLFSLDLSEMSNGEDRPIVPPTA